MHNAASIADLFANRVARLPIGGSSLLAAGIGVATCAAFAYAAVATLAHQSLVEDSRVAVGAAHVCLLTHAGAVRCRGDNSDGQLGDGTTTSRLIAVPVRGLGSGVRSIAAGSRHTCALLDDGTVKCWGRNIDGEFGGAALAARAVAP